MKVETVTPKSALIDARWIPKSQMRVDSDDNIHITLWMYDKLGESLPDG